MKCFYHSADLDGHCSGAIVAKFFPGVELMPIDYGQPFPWDSLLEGEAVYMVDFALQPFSDMFRLVASHSLTWIDHHASALKSYDVERQDNPIIDGLRNPKMGACELTWIALYKDKPMPDAVSLLGVYDSWRHNSAESCLNFQYGLRISDMDPKTGAQKLLWDSLLKDNELVDTIQSTGKAIRQYQKLQDRQYIKMAAFTTTLDGLRCIAVNKMMTNSQMFEALWVPSDYDAMLSFGWKNGSWTVSLYSDKTGVDVSVVAKAHGGGGHAGASGFQCTELPFKLLPDLTLTLRDYPGMESRRVVPHGSADLIGLDVVAAENIPHSDVICPWCKALRDRIQSRTGEKP